MEGKIELVQEYINWNKIDRGVSFGLSYYRLSWWNRLYPYLKQYQQCG